MTERPDRIRDADTSVTKETRLAVLRPGLPGLGLDDLGVADQ